MCDVEEEPPPPRELVVDWKREAFAKGWVTSLSADAEGVLVAGAVAERKRLNRPTVMRLSPDGRELWRADLQKEVPSTRTPPSAAARAAVPTPSGHTYVFSVAASSDPRRIPYLTRIDGVGRVLWTRELESPAWPTMVVGEEESVILVGGALEPSIPVGQSRLRVEKYDQHGSRLWSRRFENSVPVPHAVLSSHGHLILATAFNGEAEFSGVPVRFEGELTYRCAEQEQVCTEPARALLVVELDADGRVVQHRLLGAPAVSIGVSDLTVMADDRVVVTGEFIGPGVRIGAASLCELQPGMPTAEEDWALRKMRPTVVPCSCRHDQRDLFVMQLDASLRPNWARTLTLGYPNAQLSASSDGSLIWFVESSDGDSPAAINLARQKRVAWLWSLDASGRVQSRRRASPSAYKVASIAPGGSVYRSDGHSVFKVSAGSP